MRGQGGRGGEREGGRVEERWRQWKRERERERERERKAKKPAREMEGSKHRGQGSRCLFLRLILPLIILQCLPDAPHCTRRSRQKALKDGRLPSKSFTTFPFHFSLKPDAGHDVATLSHVKGFI